jgi:putative hydrolase of the HAD superfamily
MINWPRVEVVKDVPEVLAELRKAWKLCLATNASDSYEKEIWAALRRVGLSQFLDRVYCSRRIGHRKPSPDFFEYILNDLGVHRSRVIMVGDDFESDVLGAVQCGIRAIWFNEHSQKSRIGKMFGTIHNFKSLQLAINAFLPRDLSSSCIFDTDDKRSAGFRY